MNARIIAGNVSSQWLKMFGYATYVGNTEKSNNQNRYGLTRHEGVEYACECFASGTVVDKHSYGHGSYFKMMEIALKNKISVDMVATTIIRSVLSEFYGFSCDCPPDKVDIRRDGAPSHCKWCWNFLEVTQTAKKFEDPFGRIKETRPLKYKRITNNFEEELRRKLRREVEAMQPDRRGGFMTPMVVLGGSSKADVDASTLSLRKIR
jgi:hypothetical protein